MQIGGELVIGTHTRSLTDIAWPIFARKVNFNGADIKGDVAFTGAQFGERAEFDGIKVGGSLRFRPGRFDRKRLRPKGPNDPEYAFDPIRTHFYGDASFVRIQCQGDLVVRSVCFHRNCSFEDIHVDGNVLVRGGRDWAVLRVWFRQRVTFLGARIGGVAEFQQARFENRAIFDQISVTGTTTFQRSVFGGLVSFVSAKLPILHFTDPPGSTPKVAVPARFRRNASVDLRDCVYERISADWRDLLNRTKPFDRQPYNQMERFLRLAGQDREAGNVYFRRRRREIFERGRLMFWKSSSPPVRAVPRAWRAVRWPARQWLRVWRRSRELPRLSFDVAQWGVFRFGVRPFRLFGFSVGVVLLGAFVFAHPGAVGPSEQKTVKQINELEQLRDSLGGASRAQAERAVASASRNFFTSPLSRREALWYSARLFVPLVELPAGGAWVPTTQRIDAIRMTAAEYASLQRIAGFLLVPLGVASLTGLLLRRDKP
jgi:hypothetical protein